ncbi:ly6/PLAUR domain-containing protein 8-like [Lissotriton helveticus]
MSALLTVAVIFAAAFPGVDSLFCHQCYEVNQTSCTGPSVRCEEDVTHCIKGLENNTLMDSVIMSAFKGCMDPSNQVECEKGVLFRNSVVLVRIERTCCDTDNCNADDIQMTDVDETPNGYTCDACFNGEISVLCNPTKKIPCIGEEDTCGSFNGSASRPGEVSQLWSLRGCITKESCDRNALNPAGERMYQYDFKCTPPLLV